MGAFILATAVALTPLALRVQEAPTAPAQGATSSAPQAKHVVAISIDGLNPSAFKRMGKRQLPHLRRLMATGSSTLNARTEVERTVTLPNHTGMLTGRRVVATEGGHGVDFNDDEAKTTVHTEAGEYVESVFDVVHDHGGTTSLYSAKKKFELYDRTWSLHGREDAVGADNGTDKLDRFKAWDRREKAMMNALRNELSSKPATFAFWHIGATDAAGHAYGWFSPEYKEALRRADRRIGKVLKLVDRRTTVVIVTADHGGVPGTKGHSQETHRQNYTVPLMVWGRQVPRGANLYKLNPEFKRPGKAQLPYGGQQPIRNSMVANLATSLLGLPAVEASEANAKQTLSARR